MGAHTSSLSTYLLPIILLGVVILRGARARALRVEQMWVMPTLILAGAAASFSQQAPPGPTLLAAEIAALAAGAALGWWRGRFTVITVDPQTHALTSKASPVGLVLVAAVVLIRFALRDYAVTHASSLHVSIAAITDVFLLLAAGLVCAQRLEMWLRARRLLAEARAVAPPSSAP
jgi:hypothetical protein